MQATKARADSPDELDDAPARRHPLRGFALRAVTGALLLAFLIWRYGGNAIVSLLARESPAYFIAAVALYLAGQVISAWRWRLVAGIVEIRGSFREFLAYNFIGMFTNLFVPGLVGGDAARALYLGRRQGRLGDAAASVLADRGAGLLVVFWFGAAAAWPLGRGILPPIVIRTTMLIGILAMAGYLAAPLIARGARLTPRGPARYVALIAPYLQRPFSLFPAIILSMALQLSLVICQYLLSLGLGLAIPFWVFPLCVPIANVFASIPVTLNGLGVREGAYAVLFTLAGLGRTDAVALGLLWFASTALAGLMGIFPFLTTSIPAQYPAKAASDLR